MNAAGRGYPALSCAGCDAVCLCGSRIAVFSIRVLKDERIVIIAEQRPDCAEEEVSQSRVLTDTL